jgi:phosphohistidine phosphatase
VTRPRDKVKSNARILQSQLRAQRALYDISWWDLPRAVCGLKTQFLIRHAKSSWDDTALSDKDRPLNDRGKRDATRMGERLAQRDVNPDLILSSPAMRALTTAAIVAKKLGCELNDIVVDDRLYAVEADDLLDVIHAVDDKLKTVMLFDHNPELTELGHRLSTEITHMPTCAIAEFTFDAKSWLNIGNVKPVQVTLDYPKRSRCRRRVFADC